MAESQKDLVTKAFAGTEVEVSPQMEFDGPSGFDGVDNDCITIPFLKIAQSGTDEAKKDSPSRIVGLEPGQFFCPTSRKVYGDDVKLIILRFYRQYIVYESKEPDSRYMGPMSPEQFATVIEPNATRERSFHLDSEGHRYVDTRNFIVMVASALNDGPMLLSLSSTGISPSKKWLTQAQNVRDDKGRVAPIWANVWEIATGYMDNPQGSYYQISRIARLGYIPTKNKDLIVRAFLDAQGAQASDLNKALASEEKPVSGTHEEA